MCQYSTFHVRKSLVAIACAGLLSFAAGPAFAEASPWWARVGPGYIDYSEDATLKAFGTKISGANAEANNNTAFIVELGYDLTPNWSLGFTFGTPPEVTLSGIGTAKGLGTLGKAKYAPSVFSLQYQFNENGALRPYFGAGASYMHILSSKDGAIQGLDVKDKWGFQIQAGAEYWVTKEYGIFLDLKKIYLKSEATGTLNGAPVKAEVTLNPLVIQTGFAFHF